MPRSRVEFYKDDSEENEWRFKVISGNNEETAQGEGYTNKGDAENGVISSLRTILNSGLPGVAETVGDWLSSLNDTELLPKETIIVLGSDLSDEEAYEIQLLIEAIKKRTES